MSQQEVMEILARVKYPISSSEIAKHLMINPKNVDVNLRKLVAQKVVVMRKARASYDKRLIRMYKLK